MSEHSKTTDVRQSPLDPDMENETGQVTNVVVSETLDRAADNIDELMQSISQWETEEHSESAADGNKDESSVACCTNEKLGQELQRFSNMRRVFAEHREQEAATSYSPSKDVTGEKPSEMLISSREDIGVTVKADRTQTSKKERRTRRYGCFLYKTAKKRVTKLFRKKSGNKDYPVPDQNEEEAADSSSQSSSPPQETPSVHSSDDIRTATVSDMSTVPLELVDVDNKDEDVTPEELMEEDLVTDMEAAPGTSQVQLAAAEHVYEIVGSATSDSPSKDFETKPSEVTDSKKERRTGRYTRFFYKVKTARKSMTKLFRNKRGNKGQAAQSGSQSSSPPEDLVTDMDATPGTSQIKPSEMSPTVSSSSSENIGDTAEADRTKTSSESDSKNERETGTGDVQKNKFADFFRKGKVHPILEQREEEAAASGSQSMPCSSPPEVASTPTSVHSREDMKTDAKPYLSNVPLVLVDVDDEDLASEPSAISSPPATKHGVAVQLIGLKNNFYIIIKEFFNSLTDKQLEEIKRGVYNMDVKEQMIDMGMEVLSLAIEAITKTLSQAINRSSARQYGTVRSHNCSQERSTEQVGQNLPSKLLRESFDITDDDIQKSVKSSFGRALCDVLSSDRTLEVPPIFTTVIVKTVADELNSILSETIKASLNGGSPDVSAATCCQFSSCIKCKEMLMGVVTTMKFWLTFQDIAKNQRDSDPQTDRLRFEAANNSKDPKKNLLWWSCLMRWRKGKSQKSSKEHVDGLSVESRSLTPPATSGSCSDGNEDSRNTPSLYSTGYFPPAHLKDEATAPEYQASPPAAEARCSESSAEKNNRICEGKNKNKNKKTASSAQDGTIRTKKPSLLKRIRMFCCRLSCCGCNDVTE